MTSFSRSLAEFATEFSFAPPRIPEAAAAVMRLSLLDWMAVAIAGRDEPVAGVMRALAREEAGTAQATMIGADIKVPARMAAMVNGTISHALDYDDTHFAHIGHPSVAVIPAVLAVAEHTGASGQALREAALIGVEASVRAGMWLGRGHYQVGYHQTATAGAVGATLAVSRLMGFDAARAQSAVGLVATRASGLKSQFGTMGKPLNAGLAASNGVEAATLVKLGFEPQQDGLDGALGFGDTHHGAGDLSALAGLGQRWVFEGVSHKFHACCHGLHAALEALSTVDRGNAAVTGIEVETHPRWMSVCNQIAPMTGLGAKFSYATVMAMQVLGHDTARLESFSDAVCADQELQALRSKVDVTAVDDVSEMQARVRVSLADGRVLEGAYDLDAPMTLPAREAKVRAKAVSLLGEAGAEAAWKATLAGPGEMAGLIGKT